MSILIDISRQFSAVCFYLSNGSAGLAVRAGEDTDVFSSQTAFS